jgi:hypothetical protein
MKKGACVVVVMAFLVISAMYAFPASGDLPDYTPELDATYTKRGPVMKTWLRDVTRVAEINPLTRSMVKTVKKSVYLLSIEDSEIKVAEPPPKECQIIGILPLIPDDEKMSGEWEDFCDNNVLAKFRNESGRYMVYINNLIPASETTRGVAFLHQLLSLVVNIWDADLGSDMALAKSEYTAYSVIGQILSEISDYNFKELVQEEMVRIKEVNKEKPGFIPGPNLKLEASKLEPICGNVVTQGDVNFWAKTIRMITVFQMVDERFPDDKTQATVVKVAFIYQQLL